ncbi:PREDICTED: tubulin-specific chaperone D [Papilio xuthus]|uniref:Tubulin-specific chaperone D n=1 Tax=Papilio xuthus TaxID=66420 RepID=A0AAJ6Z490_PAPXU|nr:PREDICTED: tubulin-specific chaperone D [Papilio xuthus]
MVGLDADLNKDDECDNIGLGCALEHFSEVEDVMNMIDNLKNIYDTPQLEVDYDRLYSILKQYYEQPHLLDPHLDKILSKFIALIKDKESPTGLKHATFNYMYQIIRVRGYKVVVRHLPHEVSDLLTVLTFLEAQDPMDKETWRSRLVLLLWLSIVVIIPFHMSRLDGFAPDQPGTAESSKKLTVMERIFNMCKLYACSKDSCAEASAYLASKFLTRSDVKEIYLGAFFNWACDLHSNLKDQDTIHYGVLAAVAAVLKHGKRDDLLQYTPKLLQWVTDQNYKHHNAMLVRKYGVKIVQRIGLTFLRPRVASFRYTQGSRSLAVTLGGVAAAGDTEPVTAPPDDDDQDIPQEVEEVVELLLCSLRDDDTVVRWSAAKGVGRIGARLPALAAADVCEIVLTLFAENERETAWHGGCMALAELARRGLLSPQQLSGAARCVVAALARDEARTAGGAGGRAARDAACHAAWAFARAYDAAALAPHATALANALIATACFDREINCRRAASAAYQENVGRHGMFPHGIDVLTTADFHSVGPRNNAYLVIAPQIASYPEYTRPLVDHVVDLKIEHWDYAIRELAAQALNKLTDKIPEYVATEVLPKLVTKTGSIDLNVRHGAILGIGEAILALSRTKLHDGKMADSLISEEIWQSVRELVGKLRVRQQFRGLGGELMRQACCRCIARLSQSAAPCHQHPDIIDEWLDLIEECLGHEVQVIREKAIQALPVVFEQYLSDDSSRQKRADLMQKYCHQLASTSANGLLLRMGYSRAIGALPKFVLSEHLPLVIRSLIECTRVTEATQKWAESRRDAVIGLTEVCHTQGIVDGVEKYVEEIIDALLACLSEYTIDMRGDIGAWVREASMTGLLSLCRACAVEAPQLNSARAVSAAVRGAAQQAVEKIDRTRAHAGRIFTAFIYNDPVINNIPHHEALKRIFPYDEVELRPGGEEAESGEHAVVSENSNVVLWLFPGHTMPRFVQLLQYPEYRYSVIKGLVVSAGELTESLVKHTTQSLYSYLHTLHDDLPTLRSVCDTIVQVFADNLHVKRITGPMFNFLDRLLSSGAISPILDDPESTFAADVLKYLQLELRGGKNIYKLLDSINVLCQLIQVGGTVCSKALGQLVIYLCYADRYVRRCAAARLYEALTLYGDTCTAAQHNLDQVMTILAETDWERDVAELRPIRNDICDLMDIKRPVLKQKGP